MNRNEGREFDHFMRLTANPNRQCLFGGAERHRPNVFQRAILAIGVRSSQLSPMSCALFLLLGSSGFGELVNRALGRNMLLSFRLDLLSRRIFF
jgi:hypothetical protein